MKRVIFLIAILFCISFACKKGIEIDSQYLRGRLFLLDTITQNSKGVPLSGKIVYLSKSNDSLNYLYSTKTDVDGYFKFTLLADYEDDLMLSTKDTINNVFYKSKLAVKRGDDNIALIETINESTQNGFVINTSDFQGNIMPKTSVSIYNSQSLALTGNPLGAIETLTSDSIGKCFKIKLPKGVYYLNARKVIDTASFEKSLFQITIPENGIVHDVIFLNRKINVKQNGFNLIIKDSIGGFIPFASVYVYNSQVLATANSLSGVYENLTTDNSGKISRYDYPAGDYYLNVSKVLSDSVKYENLVNKITIPVSGFLTETIVLKRKR